MGRLLPVYCKHNVCLDPGDECFGLKAENCISCEKEWRRSEPYSSAFKPGGAEDVLDTYLKLHKDKVIGMHWLWAVIDRHVAGDDIDEILKDYGYERVGDRQT